MNGERDLRRLLVRMRPQLLPGVYVFATVPVAQPLNELQPFATVLEDEGLTVVLRRQEADQAGLTYDYLAARITLWIHSDLAAVGLTAAISSALASAGISCNVLAGFHHDHLFVPHDRAPEALRLLEQLASDSTLS